AADGDDVGEPVAVEIGDGEAAGGLTDGEGDGAAEGAVALALDDIDLARRAVVGEGDVEVAVLVEVGRRDRGGGRGAHPAVDFLRGQEDRGSPHGRGVVPEQGHARRTAPAADMRHGDVEGADHVGAAGGVEVPEDDLSRAAADGGGERTGEGPV